MSMDHYRKIVTAAAARMEGEAVYNGSLDHAAILIAQIFRSANRNVDILSGTLDARAYGTNEVVDAVRQFLGRTGNTIRIALERPEMVDRRDHPLLLAISESDDVKWAKVSDSISANLPFHMTVADNNIYRFEESKDQPSAVAAFGDTETGTHLNGVFNRIWKQSDEQLTIGALT